MMYDFKLKFSYHDTEGYSASRLMAGEQPNPTDPENGPKIQHKPTALETIPVGVVGECFKCTYNVTYAKETHPPGLS